MRKLFFWIIIILLNVAHPTLAQESRGFDPEKLEELKADDKFDYYEKVEKTSSYFDGFKLWWDRILKAIASFFTDYLNISINEQVFEIIFYGIIGASLLFLIMKLVGADFRRLIHFRTKNKYTTSFSINEEEPIEDINFKERIAQAKANENHHLVVRYYYLFALQALSEKGLLDYQARKTNTEYLEELNAPAMKACFATLAHTFEYIWYGEFQAMDKHSLEMESNFNQLKSVLS